MTCKYDSLKVKLQDEEYLESLSHRRKNELKVCEVYLSDEELSNFSSIKVGYNIARKRYFEDHYNSDYYLESRKFLIYSDAISTDT